MIYIIAFCLSIRFTLPDSVVTGKQWDLTVMTEEYR